MFILLPFSGSPSQDVYKKDHHHKEVDNETKSQDVVPETHKVARFSQPPARNQMSTHHFEEEMIFSTMPALLH